MTGWQPDDSPRVAPRFIARTFLARWPYQLAATSNDEIVRLYRITDADLKGPFVARIPRDFRGMGKLDRLVYHSPRELLAERFHLSEDLLSALNPGRDFKHAGSEIIVQAVEPLDKVEAKPRVGSRKKGAEGDANGLEGTRVEVNKHERSVRMYGAKGELINFYPASIGGAEKPAPSGTFEVRRVAFNPTYRYDPKYAFKGQKAKKPINVSPGPNNPVGLVWIGLSAESYGIHGTPEPDKVSKTQSQGCIRLTNWDALALAKHVKKGTPVVFVE
jgi:lipoprotein-anchoring transpeptidase ErfK/SrfK